MPALHLFGRAWRVGSDDFVVVGLIDLVISFIWLIASVIIYWKNDTYLDCSGNFNIKLYIYGVFAALHLVVISSVALIHLSKAGGIMDTEARRWVPHCLYFRLFLQTFGIGWNILGSYWAFSGGLACPEASEVVSLVVGFIIFNWIVLLLDMLGIFIVFDPFGGSPSKVHQNMVAGETPDSIDFAQMQTHKHSRVWARRLRGYCLSFLGPSKSTKWAIHEAGILLGSSFANIDLVPTDALAGLILLGLRDRDANKEEGILQEMLPPSHKSPIMSQPKEFVPLMELQKMDWRHPRILNHYLKFAMASYNWPIVCFDAKSNSLGRLYKKAFICACLPGRKHPLNVLGDSCCFCRTAGVRHVAGINDEDFVVLSFNNSVYGNPFFVAKDTNTKTIVIAIRGTMSLDDVLTDLSGWPTSIEGMPDTHKAHNGMLISAQRIKDKLEELKILPNLVNEYPGYNLVTTGTSLGAGVSTLLSILLKPQYPHVKCFAYAPPGGLLTKALADYTNDFVVSVVYGNDVVPRLGIRTIEKVKYAIIDALKKSNTPKYQILLGGVSMLSGKKPNTIYSESPTSKETMSPKGEDEAFKRQNARLLQRQDTVTIDVDVTKPINDDNLDSYSSKDGDSESGDNRLWLPCGEMWPPGRIVYVTETRDFKRGHSQKGYKGSSRWRMRWADRTEFSEILVHERMVMDHIPYRLQKALQVITETHIIPIGPLPITADESKC